MQSLTEKDTGGGGNKNKMKKSVKIATEHRLSIAVRGVECIKAVEQARTEKRMKESKCISGATGRTAIRKHTHKQNECKSRIYYRGIKDLV